MEFSNKFKTLIDISIKNNQYVGLGNPNAKILFVGKEAGMPIGSSIIHGSGNSWKDNKFKYSQRFLPKDNVKNHRHTWQKYQKLYDLILEGLKIESDKKPSEITFVQNVFTTELSNLVAPTTNQAKLLDGFKFELEKRKKIFWKSEFIKQFTVIVITASDNKYIETYQGEVCEVFEVKYKEEIICAKSDKMWIHFSNNETPKLLIHTRQLTNGASNELIERIAEQIVKFLNENSIKII